MKLLKDSLNRLQEIQAQEYKQREKTKLNN